MVAFAILLGACGSEDSNEVNLKVEADLQNLGEYVKIEDEQVVVKLVEKDDKHFEILSSLGVNVKKSVASNYNFELEVEVLDKNHIKIADLPDYTIENILDLDFEDYHDILLKGSKRANMESTKKNQELWDKIKKEGVYISIKPRWNSAKYVDYKEIMSVREDDSIESDIDDENDEGMDVDEKTVVLDEGNDETSSSENGNSIDEMLSEYEKFADDYIAFLKNIDENDPTNLVKIAEWTNKQTSILSKLENVRGDMEMKHINRINNINIKIMNAASKLKK